MFKIEFRIKPAKELTKEISEKIVEINKALIKKLEEQNKKTSSKEKVEKNLITINIASEDYTATSYLAQLDKQIREVLGKQFKTSIKEIEVENYEIEVELEEAPKKEITIPFVKKIEFKNKKLKLSYDSLTFSNIKDQYIEKTIKHLKDKIRMSNYEGKDEFREYVWEGKQRKMNYNGDPAVDLEKMEWIRRTDAKGQVIHGREFTALVNVMKELLFEKVYSPLGFNEMTFPKFE